jgi:3-oxoacyl-[acyl-carrier-protein] synthase II
MSARIAITGLGAVTPLGHDVESTWQSMKAGRSGIGPITTFDASTWPVRIAGLVKDYDINSIVDEPALTKFLPRAGAFALGAAVEALRDAGLADGPYGPEERGLSLGASVGRADLQQMTDILGARRANKENGGALYRWDPDDVLEQDQNAIPAAIAAYGDLQGPFISLSTACTGAAHAIGEAMRRIQDGEARMMLAGGTDALTSWLDVAGFTLLGALTKDWNDDPEHASRPFDRDRSGFVLGEGSVLAVLEDWDAARERGARIYAELAGYSSSLNAYRMTDPPPDGGGAVIAMKTAMEEAGVTPDDVDFVVAHGTGTPMGDVSETIAIKRALGDEAAHRVVVTSTKSLMGHSTCAAAGVNLVAAVGAMRDGVVAPTVNVDELDPRCDLDYVPNVAREMSVRVVVINGFAFGGTNGALVVRAPDQVAA